MIERLRRWLCRCPEPEPIIENTAFTGNYTGPYMEVSIAGSQAMGPPLYDELAAGERRRHLHVVPDEPE